MRTLTKHLYVTGSILLLLGLSACADQPRKNTLDEIEKSLNESIQQTQPDPAPETVADALLPPINIDIPGSTGVDTEPRFDIKVNHTRARVFFMGLVQGTSYNMVVHPKVKGYITLDLKNLTVPEVLDVVRDVFGYDYEQTVSGFQVFPNTMRTSIFKLNYLDIKRSGKSQMQVSAGQVTDVSNTKAGSSSNAGGSRRTVAGTKVGTVSNSDFWGTITKSVTAIVGNKKGRKVIVNGQSGVIVVHAMPSELRSVRKFIEITQRIMQRQVILEAKIIEVELSEGFQSGINWGAFGRSAGGNSSILIGQTGGGSAFSGTSITAGNTGNINPSNASNVDSTSTSAFGGVFSLALKLGNSFSSFIELLETQGDVQVLSSPQISTINNQKAVIKVGTDEFFITDISSNTNIFSGASSINNNVELTPFFSGVALDVIPQISEDGMITLHIHPTVSSVTEKTKNISLDASASLTVPLAQSSVRESDTIIRARDGQVVIIGGLMQNSTNNKEAGIPILGDLPLIGGLFKHKKKIYKKSELVILLKPTIVKDSNSWVNKLRKIRQRIGNLYAED